LKKPNATAKLLEPLPKDKQAFVKLDSPSRMWRIPPRELVRKPIHMFAHVGIFV
jgi:hypothetical protein